MLSQISRSCEGKCSLWTGVLGEMGVLMLWRIYYSHGYLFSNGTLLLKYAKLWLTSTLASSLYPATMDPQNHITFMHGRKAIPYINRLDCITASQHRKASQKNAQLLIRRHNITNHQLWYHKGCYKCHCWLQFCKKWREYLVTLKEFLNLSYDKIELLSNIRILLHDTVTSEGKYLIKKYCYWFQYLNTIFNILRYCPSLNASHLMYSWLFLHVFSIISLDASFFKVSWFYELHYSENIIKTWV